MCGIAGIVGRIPGISNLETVARRMGDVLTHRGPDRGSVWLDHEAEIALAHRRLAIIDLSENGDQPMHSASGRFVICYNGEIYNYRTLRSELEDAGESFRGDSDTEVLLALIERFGIDSALNRTVGMFAIALWDRQLRKLSLARDRLGEKPLYWAAVGNGAIFGSELRALVQVPGFSPEIDRDAVTLLLRHNYIPSPWSIYANVRKLEPGSVLTMSCDAGIATAGTPHRYWDVESTWRDAKASPFKGSMDAAVDELESMLVRTIKDQMISDVPLGAFLSGGIDSSTIVAFMQSHSTRKVETFSIGFHEAGFDEASHAKAVAEHLGTRHTEFYVSARDALETIPQLPHVYDEPFADSSQIPTLLLCRLAKKHVTVALSGDGGDEVFGGYNRYVWARDLWRAFRILPTAVRKSFGNWALGISTEGWNRIGQRVHPFLPARLRYPNAGDQMHKLAELVAVDNAAALYLRMQSHWRNPEAVVDGSIEPATRISRRADLSGSVEFIEHMMQLDLQTYLPDDILVKVDRAAMSASLETRTPLLDHRILAFAASLPQSFKLKGRVGKRVLRKLLYRHVPQHLVDRPKAGFAMPIADWLRGPLRDWAEDLFSASRLEGDGIFLAKPIREAWDLHVSGRQSRAYQLWDVLMFQAWIASTKSSTPEIAVSARREGAIA